MMFGLKSCAKIWIVVFLTCAPAVAATAQQSPEEPGTAMLWQPGDTGDRLFLRGRVVDPGGRALAGATIYIRQADGHGAYREQRYQGQLETAGDGTFSIATVLPGQYMGPKHIHVAVDHKDYPPLRARIVFEGDPNLGQRRPGDLPVLLEEIHKDGDTVLVGDVEFVLGGANVE